MANNVPVTAGSGTSIATDDVAGVHYQVVKLAAGTEDSAVRLGALEDSGHTTGDAGIPVWGVRNDSGATAFSGTDLDYTPIGVDSRGRVLVVGGGTQTISSDAFNTAPQVLPDAANSFRPVIIHALSFNGSTYDRMRGDATNGLDVDVTRMPASASSAVTSVADAATNTTLLASNASRKGATIYNDSSSILYLKLGATASTTSFTAKLLADDYYEVPFGYTGIIDGIWSADSSGSARITELT